MVVNSKPFTSTLTRSCLLYVNISNMSLYQKDNGSAPLFSVPRSLIAENPFTSLLLCSYLPSSVIDGGRFALSWCQHVTIEVINWFISVCG